MSEDRQGLVSSTPSSAKAVATAPAAPVRQRIAELEEKLRPITRAEAGEAIAVMLKAYGAVAGADDPALARLYLKATEGLPHGAIIPLCEEIALGEVEGVSDEYPPKVPQFARLCRKRADGLRATLRNRQAELLPRGPVRPVLVPGPPQAVDEVRAAAIEQGAINRQAREARVAADLAGRSFPPAPSQVGVTDAQPPADVERGEGVA